jgi:hypothetical protein
MLGGVHGALQPAGATVVGVLSCVGLAAIIGAIVAVLISVSTSSRVGKWQSCVFMLALK